MAEIRAQSDISAQSHSINLFPQQNWWKLDIKVPSDLSICGTVARLDLPTLLVFREMASTVEMPMTLALESTRDLAPQLTFTKMGSGN